MDDKQADVPVRARATVKLKADERGLRDITINLDSPYAKTAKNRPAARPAVFQCHSIPSSFLRLFSCCFFDARLV
jgi:hypothetical protein